MNIKEAEKIIEQKKNVEISDDLGNRIKTEWAKLKPWQQLPTQSNINKFMHKLNMTPEETEEFNKIFS